MCLHRLPAELLMKVADEYLLDAEIHGARSRMQAALRLALINRRIRDLMLARSAIWTTIHLHVDDRITSLFQERAAGHKLRLYLDTNTPEPPKLTTIAQWSAFIESNMPFIEHFNLLVHTSEISKALSSSLRTPAPLLASISFDFKQNDCTLGRSLFSGQAPQLETIRLLSHTPWNLKPFSSVKSATLYICGESARKNVSTLQHLNHAESVTFVGPPSYQRANDVVMPPPDRNGPVSLRSCRHFEVKKVISSAAQFIFTGVRLPVLESLTIDEYLWAKNLQNQLPTEIVRTPIPYALAAMPNMVAPSFLSISIKPKGVRIRTDGVPSINYSSRWIGYGMQHVHKPQHNQCILPTLVEMCTFLPEALGVQPTTLSINYDIWPENQQLTALSHVQPGLFFRRLFEAHSGVAELKISGCLLEAVDIIRADLTLLPLVARINITTDWGYQHRGGAMMTLAEVRQLHNNIVDIHATRPRVLHVSNVPRFSNLSNVVDDDE